MKGTNHNWLQPDILIYDKPNLNWCNNEVAQSSLILLGNCSKKLEGKKLKNIGFNVKNIKQSMVKNNAIGTGKHSLRDQIKQ